MAEQYNDIDKWEDYYVSNKNNTNDEIPVAFYTRVSSQKEAQLQSLDYQTDWSIDVLKQHPNWVMTKLYSDRGITGTSALLRQGFLSAIDDGKKGKYKLLVVRDVSRFARNAEESLKYTHTLKHYGVEVFFRSDNIWSMDADGDLRLGLISILAQDESRRMSEKIRAGQNVSRNRHILYGTGNILGYELVKRYSSEGNTYAIIEEDAETVRMIFDLYVNQNMGVKKISNTLFERHRKNALGEVRWDAGKVTRILDNKTYCGYICYHKSQCISFLTHARKKIDKSNHIYVKGDFPAIVSEELWEKAQKIKDKNSMLLKDKIRTGKKPITDKWNRVMRCQCGAKYKRYKWRTNKSTGEEAFGYQCLNQVEHRKRSFIEENGLNGDGYCNVRCIAQWHLEMQLKMILQRIWKNPDETVETLIGNIQENYSEEEPKDTSAELERLYKDKKRQEIRLNNLVEMRIDDQIDKDTFNSKKAEMTIRIAKINNEIAELEGEHEKPKEQGSNEEAINEIRKALETEADISGKEVSKEFVEELVERVTTCENSVFKWYMRIGMDSSDTFSEDEFTIFDTFDISFEEARTYRKRFGNFLRHCQWRDIHVEIYMKL